MKVRQFFVRHQGAAILALLLLAAVIAEVVLHLQPLSPYAADLILQQGADLPLHRVCDDPRRLYEMVPEKREVFKAPHKPLRTVTINRLGLRDTDRELAKPESVYRIVVFGTSIVYGAEVSDGETVTAYLEEQLNRERCGAVRFEVWNAAVSAYSAVQQAALAEALFAQGLEADVVLFQIHEANARAFLFGHIDPQAFARDSSLLVEHLLVPRFPPRSFWAKAAAHSRLTLLLLAHLNRMKDDFERKMALRAHREENGAQALTAFMKAYGANRHVAAICIPCIGEEGEFEVRTMAEPAGMPTWCVRVDESNPDNTLLHPPAPVYEHWAERLAQQLAVHGFLPEQFEGKAE